MVCLETGVESRCRAGKPVPDHWEARLAATMEMLLGLLEGEQEDQLELVEAAVEGEEAPMEVPKASVEV